MCSIFCHGANARISVVIWSVVDCGLETVVTVLNVMALASGGDSVDEGVVWYAYWLPAWTVVMIVADVSLFRGAHKKVSLDLREQQRSKACLLECLTRSNRIGKEFQN